MDRSRKFLIFLMALAALTLLAQVAKAQRALLPSQAEGGSAQEAAVEQDLPPKLVEKMTQLVRAHVTLADLKVEVRIGKSRQPIGECPQPLESAIAGKARPWGNFTMTVRCPKPFWAVTVPVQTRVFGPQLVASKYLPQGSRLKSDDLLVVTTDITRSAADAARSTGEVTGKVLNRPLPQGGVLTLNMLREETVIRIGEAVRVQVQGKGFSATGEGTAVSAGAIGDSIRVRMPDGQQVVGQVMRAGWVEVVVQ